MKYFETKFQENSQFINPKFQENTQSIDPKFQENEQNISPNFGETQLVHDGVNGATFIPNVSEDGVISWTNNGDLPNPKPVSIKGNAGEPGEKGDRGEDGYTPIKNVDYFDGKDGEDGKTPYIQDNYWYLDGQNLGVKAKGENGTSITIISSHISNESGGISTIRFSDGTELTVRNGKDGQRGEDGTDGVDGVSATHSWNGTILTVTSASGTSSVDLKGEKGDKGDGFKIERTFNSVIAMNAGFYSDNVPLHGFVLIETGNVNDEDNAKLFVKGVAQYHYLTDLSGAQGIKGEDGNDGKDGRGISSIAKTATNGLIDTYTITYTDKTQSTFNVVNGEKGTDGKSVGISSIDETTESGGTNTITFTDGKSISIKNGLKGEIGAPGKDGQDGYTPIKGVDYFDGKVGDKGDPGVDGKTAYEFAKDGGYTGTEEEFSAKLAEQFYVSEEMYENLTDAVDKKLDANGVDTHSSESGEDVSLNVANGVVLESSQDVGTISIKGGLEETQITATSIAGIPYSSIVKNTDMASGSKLGLVKVYSGYGVEIGTSGTLFTQKASNAEIDAKKHNYNVIVPSNLEYAVKSVAYDKGETDKAVGDAIDELSKTVNTALNEKLDAGGLNHNYDENNEIVELGIGNGVTVVSDKGEGQVTLTSGDTQTVIDANRIAGIEYQDILTVAQKGASNGIAELDKDGKIISSQLPSYVDDVIEGYYVAQNDEFYEDENHTIIIPVENGKIYVDLHENRTYRYSGTQYTEISPSIALGTTSSTAFRGDYGQAAYTHSQKTSGNPHNVSKTDVGLGNVENVKQYSASNPPPYPVTSVNNKTGAVTLNAEDLGAYTKDETNELVTTAVDDLAEGFGEVILGMIGNDIPEDGSIPTIRGIANDEVSKLPLVGTTEDITPSQVADALEDGRPLSITHTDSTFGTGVFNNFAKADSFGVIISSAIVFFNNTYIILELLGDTSSNGWNVLSTTIAESEKMALALDGKVPTTRTVNGKALSSDITLSASDVKALPDTTVLADLTGDATHRTVTDAEKSSWNDKLDSDGLTHTYSDEDVGLNVGAGVELLSARDEGYITLKGNDGNSSIGINAQSIAGIDYTDIITTAHKGVASGVAELDDNGKVPSSQLPAYVDDVLEGYYNADEDKFYSVESPNENPYDEDKGKIYVDVSTNKTYRYSGSTYVEISASLALGETASTAYRGDRGKTAYDHSQTTSGNPHKVSKSDVGLGNVNNTSDANKPVSTAQATAILDAKTNDVSGNAFQRVYSSLIPYGTSIPANADLNTITYMKVGNYYCSKNADAATLINSPTTSAFMMTVSSPLSTTIDNESKTWVYRLRKLQDYRGPEYVQYCYANGTAGNWIYGDWNLVIKSNNTASTTSAGLMSAADKVKLNGLNKERGIYFVVGDSTTEGVWTGTCSDITEYYDGLTVAYLINIAGISDGSTLNINGLGAKNVRRNVSNVTTHYAANSLIHLTYVTIDGTGYWQMSDYDSNTKNSAGTSNKTGTKMYLVGGTSQSSSGVTTYTNKNVYIGTDNCLYSNGEKVAGTADIPTALKNPNALTINGKVYDGSEAIDITIAGGAISENVLIGSTPYTLTKDTNIKLSGTGEYSYTAKGKTIADLSTTEVSKTLVTITDKDDYIEISATGGTAYYNAYATIVVNGLTASVQYTLCIGSIAAVLANNIGSSYFVIKSSSGTQLAAQLCEGNKLHSIAFTPTSSSVTITWYPANNYYWNNNCKTSRLTDFYINAASDGTTRTEIYNKSGTFSNSLSLGLIPKGITVTSTPTCEIYEISSGSGGSAEAGMPLAGKTIVCFGDSLFGMYTGDTSAPAYVAKRTGATVHNVGFGGCRMSQHPTTGYNEFCMYALADAITSGNWSAQDSAASSGSSNFPDQLALLKSIDFNGVDAIVIHYGTNDFTAGAGVAIDNASNLKATNTLCGALRYSVEKLLTTFPELRIFVSLPAFRYWTADNGTITYSDTWTNVNGKILPDFVEALRNTAKEYCLPVIDCYYGLGINKINASTFLADGVHHNVEGRKRFGGYIGSRIIAEY